MLNTRNIFVSRFKLDAVDQRLPLLGLLLSVLCLAYFYALDRVAFSSSGFSPIFSILLKIFDEKTAWLSVAICMLAVLWPWHLPLLKVVDILAAAPRRVSAVVTVLLGVVCIVWYHNHPFSMDEYAAVFQAKVFAAGRLFAQIPPELVEWLVVPGFNGSFLIASEQTGKVVEGYWPGFAFLLAPFQLIGLPWLCNPVLAGLALYLIHRITLDITNDRRTAGWAMLFAVASGAFLVTAASYYAMQAHLTANLLFVSLLLRPSNGRCVAAGVVGSLALVLHNPFPHMLFALPWIWALVRQKDQRKFLLPLAIGYLPVTLVVGIGWLLLRSSIGSAAGLTGGVFSLPDLAIVNMRIAATAKLWVWAVPGLYLLALIGRVRNGGDRRVRLLAQSAVLTFAAYLFVGVDQGHGWGYRYFHSAWGVIPILAALAVSGKSAESPRLITFAGAAAILNLLIVVPFQVSQVDDILKYHLSQIPAPKRPGNNIYFMEPGTGFYVADLIQFDPQLRAPDLLLVSHGAEQNAQLIRQNFPTAIKLNGGHWAEYWHVGPVDQRRSTPTDQSARRFVLTAPD